MFKSTTFWRIVISNNPGQGEVAHTRTMWPSSLLQKLRGGAGRVFHNRRVVRYSLVTFNVLLLFAIAWFTLSNARHTQQLDSKGALSGNNSAAEPLDVLSSADIATNAAVAIALPETTAVINQADSVQAEQTVAPADTTAVAKPQAVATPLKSRKDIKNYVVVSGDTVSSIASKFSVTSDAIMWSNNLRSNTVNAGIKLVIPPIDGIVYSVKNGDTVDNLAQKYRANKDQIVAFNDIELTGLKIGDQILIPGGQNPAPVIVSRPLQGSFGFNGYDFGFCTWYVANRRAQAGNPVPTNLGNASSWDNRAAAMGMTVNKTPAVGAAVVTSQRGAGHVAFVEAVNADGSIWVSEMNSHGQVSMSDSRSAGGWNKVDWKLLGADAAAGFNYIH